MVFGLTLNPKYRHRTTGLVQVFQCGKMLNVQDNSFYSIIASEEFYIATSDMLLPAVSLPSSAMINVSYLIIF